MIHLDLEQQSAAWFEARLGIPTASEFHRILTPKTLKMSKSADAYLYGKVAEAILRQPFEQETRVWAMEVGIDREEEAINYYEMTTQIITKPAGFCLTDDRRVGASPDRFVGDEGLVEVKNPLAHTHVGYLMAGTLPDDYMLQVQGQLYVTERQWCDFLSYYPSLPPLLIRSYPQPEYQDALSNALGTFCLYLDEAISRVRALMQEGR